MLDKIAVTVIGAGDIAGRIHLPAWRNLKETKVVAICDIERRRAERIAEEWKIPRVYTDFDKLIEEETEAIIDICTPPASHVPLAVRAIQNAHHVLLEKPMTMDREESERLFKEYKNREDRVKLCVIQNFLFDPLILDMKSSLNGNTDDILRIDIQMLHTKHDIMISDRSHWVHSLQGGRFGECLIHPVYLLRNMIGRLNVRDIYCVRRGLYDWTPYDELHATLESGGTVGTIHISFNSPRSTTPASIKVHGKKRILIFDGSNLTRFTQGSMSEGSGSAIGRIRIGSDALGMSSQILLSTGQNALRVLAGRWRKGVSHEKLFRSFVCDVLGDAKMPYTMEESYQANLTFLELLTRIAENMPQT